MATTPNVKSVHSILAHRKFLLGAVSALAVGIVAGVGQNYLRAGPPEPLMQVQLIRVILHGY